MLLKVDGTSRLAEFESDTTTPIRLSKTADTTVCRFGERYEATLSWNARRVEATLDDAGFERLYVLFNGAVAWATNDLEQALLLHVEAGGELVCEEEVNSFGNAIFRRITHLSLQQRITLCFDGYRWDVSLSAHHPPSADPIALSSLRNRLIENAGELAPSQGDIPVLLSGGVDSAITLAALARAHGPRRLVAVHYRLPDQLRNFEQPLARATARHLRVRYVELTLPKTDLVSERALASHSYYFNWHGWRDYIQQHLSRMAAVVFWGARAEIFQGTLDGRLPSALELIAYGPAAIRAGWTVSRVARIVKRARNIKPDRNATFQLLVGEGLAYGYANSAVSRPLRSLSIFGDARLTELAKNLYTTLGAVDKLLLRDAFRADLPSSVVFHPRVSTPAFPEQWYRYGSHAQSRLQAIASLTERLRAGRSLALLRPEIAVSAAADARAGVG